MELNLIFLDLTKIGLYGIISLLGERLLLKRDNSGCPSLLFLTLLLDTDIKITV